VNKTTIKRPPGPKGRWAVGNSYDYDQDRIGFLRRCQAEYGDVFSFSPSTVVVCDPELIHELLNKSNEVFLAESPLFGNAEDSARLERNVDGWMRSRRLGWQGMTRAVTRAHGQRIITAFDATLRATSGQEFDVMTVMRDYTSRMVADFLFGPGAEDVVAAADLRSELAVKFMNNNLTIPKWLPLPSVRRALRAEDDVIATITARVDGRRAHRHEEPEDMLDLLLTDTDISLTEDEIVAVLAASMLASFGSPGAVLSWVVREMARDGKVHERLRDEARAAIAKTGSLVDDTQLPYCKAFVREVLRLYPPTWLMGRIVRHTSTLGDWTLPAGHNVMFSPYLLQRDERWWAEPEEFRPERWLGPATPESRRAYIPFGSGPRICLGLHLGLYQLVTAASHLAAHYRIEPNTTETETLPHAILLPRGLRARITPVDDAMRTAGDDTTAEVTH